MSKKRPRESHDNPLHHPRPVPIPPPLPNNPLHFKREPSGTLQISTWNVEGLEGSNKAKHGYAFRKYLEAEDPTIIIITEVNNSSKKPNDRWEDEVDFQFLKPRFPWRYWSGKTAVLSKVEPRNVVFGFPNDRTGYDEFEARQRLITLEFPNTYLMATYVPNSGEHFKTIDIRQEWNTDFATYITSLDALKPVIWAGDFNAIISHPPLSRFSNDIERNEQCFEKLSGSHPIERAAHEALVGEKMEGGRKVARRFVDVWRFLKGDGRREFTHTAKKYGGWRIDGFIISRRLLHHVRACEIRHEVKQHFYNPTELIDEMGTREQSGRASDHWPVWLSLEMEWEEL